MNKIIAVVGLAGSGKTTVVDYLEKKGFLRVYFGQLTFDELKKRGLEVNEQNERKIREELRKNHGMAVFAKLNLPKIEDVLKKGDVVVESMYSWEEYLLLKEKFGDKFYVAAVYAKPELRARRIAERKVRPLTRDELASRDRAQIEKLNIAGPIAVADFTFINNGSVEDLHKQIELMLNGRPI